MTPEEFFVSHSAQCARSMPLPEAVLYLRGLLRLVGEEPIVDGLRRVYANLNEENERLGLIASGQMLLPFTKSEAAPPQASE